MTKSKIAHLAKKLQKCGGVRTMYVKVNVVGFKSKNAMEKALSLYLLNLAEWRFGV